MTDTPSAPVADAPWLFPMGEWRTSITALGFDLADVVTARIRMEEVARLLAFPGTPAERRDVPDGWPDSKGERTVVHHDPDSRAYLLRTLDDERGSAVTEMVWTRVVRSPFLETFDFEEAPMPSGMNIPTHGGDDGPARLWTAFLIARMTDLEKRIRTHGRKAGDPYHEIGQTLHGSAAIRVREILACSGTADLSGLSFVMVAPSPYGPLDCRILIRMSSTDRPIADLDPAVGAIWSKGLGSTIEMSSRGSAFPPTIRLAAPVSATLKADDADAVVDVMRAVSAFPDPSGKPFRQIRWN